MTGPAKFNCQRNNKALNAYQNRFDEFHDWRNRFKAAMERIKEATKPEEQKQEEAWNRLKRDIASSAQTIHDIDTGKVFMILIPVKQEDTAVPCSSAVSLIR